MKEANKPLILDGDEETEEDDGKKEGESEGEGVEGDYGTTPEGRPYTEHGADQADDRNIPGMVIDQTINENSGVDVEGGKKVYYDSENNVTVVTGDGGAIVTVHKGPPSGGQ